MKYFPDLEQGSIQWLREHLGRATASGFSEIMTSDFEFRKGEMPKTYLAKKLAEKLTGKPLPGFHSRATDEGIAMEFEARKYFELEYDISTSYMGFVLADDGRTGCSPDALIGEDSGLELKVPNSETHIKYLLNGALPIDYAPQVHGSMWVTGRASWNFMSYNRDLPPFRIVVKRDEEIMKKISACLTRFYADFDAAFERLKPKN